MGQRLPHDPWDRTSSRVLGQRPPYLPPSPLLDLSYLEATLAFVCEFTMASAVNTIDPEGLNNTLSSQHHVRENGSLRGRDVRSKNMGGYKEL